MAEKAMLIDTSKCTACRGCQVACKQWNELAAEETTFFTSGAGYQNPPDLSANTYCLVTFKLTEKTNGDPDWLFRKRQCMHCTEASCVAVCPVDAMQKDPDTGFVFCDQETCVGCGACVSACPFGVPHISEATNTSQKCKACLDRIDAGKEPACAKTCPGGAITFGDRPAKVIEAQTRQAELVAAGNTDACVYGVDEAGGTHNIYVLLKDPSFYGLPSAGELSSRTRRAYLQYLSGVAKLIMKKAASF